MISRNFVTGPVVLLLAACSQATPHADLPRECEAFVTRYQACIAAAIPSRPELARERAVQTRKSLEESAARASQSGSDDAIGKLASTCQTNLQSLNCAAP